MNFCFYFKIPFSRRIFIFTYTCSPHSHALCDSLHISMIFNLRVTCKSEYTCQNSRVLNMTEIWTCRFTMRQINFVRAPPPKKKNSTPLKSFIILIWGHTKNFGPKKWFLGVFLEGGSQREKKSNLAFGATLFCPHSVELAIVAMYHVHISRNVAEMGTLPISTT